MWWLHCRSQAVHGLHCKPAVGTGPSRRRSGQWSDPSSIGPYFRTGHRRSHEQCFTPFQYLHAHRRHLQYSTYLSHGACQVIAQRLFLHVVDSHGWYRWWHCSMPMGQCYCSCSDERHRRWVCWHLQHLSRCNTKHVHLHEYANKQPFLEVDCSFLAYLSVSYTATAVGYWAASLMMEDYEFSWQTTPLYVSDSTHEFLWDDLVVDRSVTPLQFLVQVYTLSSACTVGKQGSTMFSPCLTTQCSWQVHSIQELVLQVLVWVWTSIRPLWNRLSSSLGALVWHWPMCSLPHHLVKTDCECHLDLYLIWTRKGMARGAITQSSSNPLQYSMTMTWTAPASAWGKSLTRYLSQKQVSSIELSSSISIFTVPKTAIEFPPIRQ